MKRTKTKNNTQGAAGAAPFSMPVGQMKAIWQAGSIEQNCGKGSSIAGNSFGRAFHKTVQAWTAQRKERRNPNAASNILRQHKSVDFGKS
jgi:hypothetical protein